MVGYRNVEHLVNPFTKINEKKDKHGWASKVNQLRKLIFTFFLMQFCKLGFVFVLILFLSTHLKWIPKLATEIIKKNSKYKSTKLACPKYKYIFICV
jgi:hypothetical protein